MAAVEGSLLLILPDPCLLLVLQCCAADDHRSLFSASRAHSRLHQAAVVALRSIKAHVSQQQQMDDVMGYLGKHGQHVDSLKLEGAKDLSTHLLQLPPQLQLTSLQLVGLRLQLQPGSGSQGVLGPAAGVAALKQLRLIACRLLDHAPDEALAAALAQLPGLQHLGFNCIHAHWHRVPFPLGTLQQLQHLTHLEFACVNIEGPGAASPALQSLQALTGLVSFRHFHPVEGDTAITNSTLLRMQHLTRLELIDGVDLEPGALAGKTQLQHLVFHSCGVAGGAAGVAKLLSHLQPLQQLTHLSLNSSLQVVDGSNPPASAYAALTASSQLQHLDISYCTLPAGVWQHLFPTGRLLPKLQAFIITRVEQPSGDFAQASEGSRLVSCCPCLRSLFMRDLHNPELVQGLRGLLTLHCSWGDATAQFVQAVCQLTGLRELDVWGSGRVQNEGLLLQLTQLKQLTSLYYEATSGGLEREIDLSGGDEPVWQQLLQLHLGDADPGVAQQAAAALAGLQ